MLRIAILCAGRLYDSGRIVVAECGNFFGVAVAAIARISLHAFDGTGRLSRYARSICMTERQELLCAQNLAAIIAHDIDRAIGRTSGRHRNLRGALVQTFLIFFEEEHFVIAGTRIPDATNQRSFNVGLIQSI